MINIQTKTPVKERFEYNEAKEEKSEQRKIIIMALTLLILFPVLFGGMHFMYKLIEKSKPVYSPLFSSVSECFEYGGNITACTQAWSNALPSFYKMYKHTPSMLMNANQGIVNSCNLEMFTTKMILTADLIDVGNIYQLKDDKKTREDCFNILSKTRAMLTVTPYRDVDKIGDSTKKKIAELWLNIGLKLYNSNQKLKAIQVWGFITENFVESNDAYMHNKVAEAWFNTGIVYYEMGRPELSALYWEKIVDRYAKSANQTNMTVVRKAEVNMGQISMLLNENSTFRTISNQQ
ncbi:hypothetical protein DPS92_23595 [Salmonella enterica subsp. enterica serovar Richmond]|uniref:tetratricopeptide repeat protein n=1 Tax=Salmonella enterica TaxID=28901 RepID=UPI000DFC22ED|nr:hypothetical protein [Salmonella enterica subsp. enterica serovar Richmond]EAA2047770.1 hypothetical protein [Salmonella enterica subsp. enterica serovar Chester]EAB8019209.1 hypothetical protein [Salmonella enterica subsp. enterica serovar Newport]EAC1168270.1 hypothetical protein [Salmonella enterica subsp. enterica serovar Typhimurium]EAP0132831.1 hypothetical protein [Salmonella enterica]EBH3089588.1 hypothetical protein [Salmonella enterica subsp. enterica serovar Poona]EBZ2758146.1 h